MYFHRIARFVICNYVKGGGSRFWLVIFNYFSLYRLKITSINKSSEYRQRLTAKNSLFGHFSLDYTCRIWMGVLFLCKRRVKYWRVDIIQSSHSVWFWNGQWFPSFWIVLLRFNHFIPMFQCVSNASTAK